jgi:glycosyltransferase involved in cell wall biosynthesis
LDLSLPTLKIVYLTYDGLRQPLGSSQILPYLRGLRDRGIESIVISLERGPTTADEPAETGIRRVELPYRTGGPGAHLANFRGMLRELRKAISAEKPTLVVARSYLPATVALRAKRSHRVPYIFDMRGCWVDERAMGNGRFKSPLLYKLGKKLERSLLSNAAGVVTLTKLHADDLVQQKLVSPQIPIKTIPTCADFDAFGLKTKHAEGKLVIGWIGSVNASYQTEPSLALFKAVRRLRPNALLQCITAQPEAMLRELKGTSLPPESYDVKTADHREMPALLAQMDWGLLLNENCLGKRGSMPTKLAEFFAVGVQPIQYGCNAEVSEMVRSSGSGIVLKGLSSADLEEAARTIAAQSREQGALEEARRRMRPYFGLESGVASYAELIERVAAQQERQQ